MAISAPTDLANCAIWLDASDVTTLSALSAANLPGNFQVSQNGDRVGYWGDKSGNNRHFTYIGQTTAARPFYYTNVQNGRPAIRFEGAEQLLSLSAVTFTGQTVFVVTASRVTLANNSNRVYSQASIGVADNGTPHFIPFYRTSASGQKSSFLNSGNRSDIIQTALSSFDILVSRYSGTVLTNSKNGVPSTNFSFTLGSFTASCTKLAANITNGTTGAGTGNTYQGDFAEVIMYNRALTDLEREDVEYYLATKWNISPRQVYAIRNGLWSNTTTWSVSGEPAPFNLPLSGDNVYTNSRVVTADIPTRVSTLQNSTLAPNILSGGFVQLSSVSLSANATAQVAGPAIILAPTNTTATLVGNLVANNSVGVALSGIENANLTIIGNIEPQIIIAARPAISWNSNNNLTIRGNVFSNFTGTCVNNVSTGNIFVYGDLDFRGSSTNTGIILLNSLSGNIFVFGNILQNVVNNSSGFNSQAIRNASSGNVYIVGNVRGGNQTSDQIRGIVNASTGSVFVTGNVIGGISTNTAVRQLYGIQNSGSGRVEIIGNIIGGQSRGGGGTSFTSPVEANPGILIDSSTASLFVTGSVIATDVNNGILQSGNDSIYNITGTASTDVINHASNPMTNNQIVYFLSAGNTDFETYRPYYVVNRAANTYQLANTLGGAPIDITSNFNGLVTRSVIVITTDKIVSTRNGIPGVLAFRYCVRPQTSAVYTRQASNNINDTYADFWTSDATFTYPASTDVRFSTTYNNGALTGTMFIPPVSSVYFGAPVSNTVGTALIDGRDFWNLNLNTLTQNNTIGKRISKILTTQILSSVNQSLTSS
jgi:hypothetical protein